MNLIVDIGNTRVKLAVMRQGECVDERCAEQLSPASVDELADAWPLRRAIVSSTRGGTAEAAALLRQRVPVVVEFGSATPVPIRSAYLTPETLGRDRLAAAVGATVLWPGRNVLIVDCGTAVTIDLVTADGTFQGGCISPGLRTRFRALHDYTAALPLCSPDEEDEAAEAGTAVEKEPAAEYPALAAAEHPAPAANASPTLAATGHPAPTAAESPALAAAELPAFPAAESPAFPAAAASAGLLGRSTRRALVRGVMNSLVFEIEGYIARMEGKIDGLCVIFTGGDAKYLSKRIKNTIFANRNPVLCGLDRILEFNVSEEYLE